MKLLFDIKDIKALAAQYDKELPAKEKEMEHATENTIMSAYNKKGYMEKADFLTICKWKTPRTQSRCNSNDEDFIKEVSRISKTTASEQLRVEVWTLLAGVSWPTASVFLHFAFPTQYPVLDFRALWSLGIDVPKQYDFKFWMEYTKCCQDLAHKAKVSMRDLDKALWRYSKNNQKTS